MSKDLNLLALQAIGCLIDRDGAGSYAETVADERAESPYDKLDGSARTLMVRQVLQTLDEREQAILSLRFGLNEKPPKTLDEVGEELDLSSERVRQLQNAALRKVRCRMQYLEFRSLSPVRLRSGTCRLRL